MSTQPVLVGIDGSDSAIRATVWAARIAARRKLPVRVVHAVDLPLVGPPQFDDAERLYDALREQGRGPATTCTTSSPAWSAVRWLS